MRASHGILHEQYLGREAGQRRYGLVTANLDADLLSDKDARLGQRSNIDVSIEWNNCVDLQLVSRNYEWIPERDIVCSYQLLDVVGDYWAVSRIRVVEVLSKVDELLSGIVLVAEDHLANRSIHG